MTEQTPEDKILQKKSFLERYTEESQNYKKIWGIFLDNALTDDFFYSKWAGLSCAIFPLTSLVAFNIFSPFNIFKNLISVSMFFATFSNFQYQLNNDFALFLKKDTIAANKARLYFQNISFYDPSVPDFARETLKIQKQSKK